MALELESKSLSLIIKCLCLLITLPLRDTLFHNPVKWEIHLDLLSAMEVFIRVGQLNGFSAAARDLGMSKTSVSRQVSELEDSLGVRLINRSTRKISLTEAGEAYARRGLKILEELHELQNETQNLHRSPSGTLRVTSVITFGVHRVVPLIPQFLREYPDVSIELDLNNRVTSMIEEGWDLAIRLAGAVDLEDSSLISRKLTSLEMGVYASHDYISRHGKPDTPAELVDHHCITLPGKPSGPGAWYFSDAENHFTVAVSGRFHVNSVEAAALVTCDGTGIGYLPRFIIEGDLSSKVRELLVDYGKSSLPVYAIYPHKHHLSGKVRAFVDHLAASL